MSDDIFVKSLNQLAKFFRRGKKNLILNNT